MPQILSGEVFGQGGQFTGRRQLIFNMAAGTAVVEVRDEEDQVDADYVEVPDSSFSASSTFTMYAEPGFIYRPILTGDATAMLSGKPKR